VRRAPRGDGADAAAKKGGVNAASPAAARHQR
jgi:hypothetical protein